MIKVTQIMRFEQPGTTHTAYLNPEAIKMISPYKEGSSVLVGRYWIEITESPDWLKSEMILWRQDR